MSATNPSESIAVLKSSIAAALGKTADSAELGAARNDEVGRDARRGADAQSGRRSGVVLVKTDQYPIQPGSQLIGNGGREHPGITQREDFPLGRAEIPKARQIVVLQGRFRA